MDSSVITASSAQLRHRGRSRAVQQAPAAVPPKRAAAAPNKRVDRVALGLAGVALLTLVSTLVWARAWRVLPPAASWVELPGVVWECLRAPFIRPPPGWDPHRQPAPVCPDDDDASFQALVAHVSQHGGFVGPLELSSFDGVRGLAAAKAIPASSPVLSIPLSLTLSIATTAARHAAAKATAGWRDVEDADIQLDTLALVYEWFVAGPASPWALYLCTLPRHFDLPTTYNDSLSNNVVAALPELARLAAKRREQVHQFEEMARRAVAGLPGGASALLHAPRTSAPLLPPGPDAFSRAFTWAYQATKTRTVTLDVAEAKISLPPGLDWLQELGALVPVLDMANHAPAPHASTYFTVDLSSASTTAGREAVVSLVAARDIAAGEEITFSYLPEDDDAPSCNLRWLLEYGFVIQDGRPQRDCYSVNMTAEGVARMILTERHAQRRRGSKPTEAQVYGLTEVMRRAVAAAGLPPHVLVPLVREGPVSPHDTLHVALDWLRPTAVELMPQAPEGANFMWCTLLATHIDELAAHAEALQRAATQGPDVGEQSYRQAALLELLLGATRAVEAHATAVCDGLPQ